jgi:hypothetical protein
MDKRWTWAKCGKVDDIEINLTHYDLKKSMALISGVSPLMHVANAYIMPDRLLMQLFMILHEEPSRITRGECPVRKVTKDLISDFEGVVISTLAYKK